ncbi:hypothetical protein [Phytohalomonas tamaricis]|uniref:hypothetical protein n=1 Tax=Phytohalomonas tamaricis TaxID=2081032 RepID=UPI001319FE8D|nr:hypothetical protein [Phytohalomonas tamaricis]
MKYVLPATAMLCAAMLTASVQAEETTTHAHNDHTVTSVEAEQIINDQQEAEIETLKRWVEKHDRSVKP